MKVLVLILSSEHEPLYIKLKEVWRHYMHLYPDILEAYFYEEDPNLETDAKLINDTLFVKCPIGVEYTTVKLQMALRYFEPRFQDFDFIFRPNLSSFVIWDRYLKHIEKLPKSRICTSIDRKEVSGSGFTMSIDVAKAYMEYKITNDIDDIIMNKLVKEKRYETPKCERAMIHHTSWWLGRYDIIEEYGSFFNYLKEHDFIVYVRVKHLNESREIYDLQFMNGLLATFYPDSK